MINVAFVQPFLAHYREPIYGLLCRSKVDGIEYVFYSDKSSNISLSTINPDKASLALEEGGIRWKFVRNIWFGKVFLWQKDVLKIALDRNVDVIIFAGIMYYFSTWIAAILARYTGKRVLMWTHGYLRKEKNLKGLIRQLFYQLSDGLLLYGNNAKKMLVERGFRPENLYVVYNSLDYDKQCAIRQSITNKMLVSLKKQLFKNPAHPVCVFIGRITPRKKLHMILDAVALLAKRNIFLNLLLIGDGPDRERLEQIANNRGLSENVNFFGACYGEEHIGPLLSMSDLCVAPGEVGLTCMHSLVYGTPVITHDNVDYQGPEWEAIEPGKTGAFFNHGNVGDLADVIEHWLKNHDDRNAVRSDCIEIIDKYYNPYYQLDVITSAVKGIPADALDNAGAVGVVS